MKREIEIKCLLNGENGKQALLRKLKQAFPQHKKLKSRRVISYFYKAGATHTQILEVGSQLLNNDELTQLKNVLEHSDALVVKARSIDTTVYFSVKGSTKGDDPVHAVNRIEFEAVIDPSLEEVGQIIEQTGIKIASKWSSERSFYALTPELEMNLEFVGGYGYKAELEMLIDNNDSHQDAINTISEAAQQLDLQEASQELFGKMYKYYNEHWQEYFNSNKEFPPEIWQELGRT